MRKLAILQILTFALALNAAEKENPRIRYVKEELVRGRLTAAEADLFFKDPRLQKIPPQHFPNTKISWDKFIKDILQKESVARGAEFIATHNETLKVAEKEFGVKKEIIAAIIRMETNFGSYLGDYSVVNVFYTQLMNATIAQKWRWAADNLAAMAIYSKNNGLDCFEIRGSYAGAFGLCQFLPVSVLAYGRDGNGDGKIDLFQTDDAIMSTASFLAGNGWSVNQARALTAYYGSSRGYPKAALLYADALKKSAIATPQTQPAAQTQSVAQVPKNYRNLFDAKSH